MLDRLKGIMGSLLRPRISSFIFWPQWLLIAPDSFLSGRAAMRGPLSDLCTVINRFFPVFPVSSVRDLPLLRDLRVLRG